MTVHASVDPLLNGPTSRQWAKTMSVALQSTMFENTWSLDGGSARRVVLTWGDGLHLSWIGVEDGEPTEVHAWNADGSALDLGEAWTPRSVGTIGTSIDDSDALADIVDELNAEHGLPNGCVLPWGAFSNDEYVDAIACALRPDREAPLDLDALDEEALSETLEQLREEQGDWDEDDEDADDSLLVCGPLVLALAEVGALTLPRAWGGAPVSVNAGDAYMPPASANAKFMQFVAAVEDLDDWIVIWDECCGTCASGTYKFMLESTGKPEGTPSLTLFGQNTQYYFPPDGSVAYDVYLSNDEQRDVIGNLAQQAGLTVTFGEHSSVHITG